MAMQFQIPCFPLSYRTTCAKLPELFEVATEELEERTGMFPPLLIFEPHPDWTEDDPLPLISDAPEELIVVALEQQVRAACFQALGRIEDREPKNPLRRSSNQRLKFKENTRIKSVFRQMNEMPITVFSLTFPDDGPDAISIFFLRTPFTISEFRRELLKPIERN